VIHTAPLVHHAVVAADAAVENFQQLGAMSQVQVGDDWVHTLVKTAERVDAAV